MITFKMNLLPAQSYWRGITAIEACCILPHCAPAWTLTGKSKAALGQAHKSSLVELLWPALKQKSLQFQVSVPLLGSHYSSSWVMVTSGSWSIWYLRHIHHECHNFGHVSWHLAAIMIFCHIVTVDGPMYKICMVAVHKILQCCSILGLWPARLPLSVNR